MNESTEEILDVSADEISFRFRWIRGNFQLSPLSAKFPKSLGQSCPPIRLDPAPAALPQPGSGKMNVTRSCID